MDEEFFFPQNVTTVYQVFGMGPRHLRRAGIGLAGVLPLAVVLGRCAGLFVALIGSVVLLAAYVAACAYPTFGDETLSDIVLHLRHKRRSQTTFLCEEVTGDAESA